MMTSLLEPQVGKNHSSDNDLINMILQANNLSSIPNLTILIRPSNPK